MLMAACERLLGSVTKAVTAWNFRKLFDSGHKGLHLVHFVRGPLKKLANAISGSTQILANSDGFSNNKRSNGSNTHPLESAIVYYYNV
jgi:hypothetical protein